MKVVPSEHYGADYFAPNTKKYTDAYGIEREYHGPSKDWHGYDYIIYWMRQHFPQEAKSLFDIGCGAGGFVARANGMGFDACGCDISKFAIDNCIERAKGRIWQEDIVKSTPKKQYDIVTALDLMEHIYNKDMPIAGKYISDICKKYFFACIATARSESEVWTHTSENDDVPPDKTWLAISGHVNIKFFDEWIDVMDSYGFKPLYDKMFKFATWRLFHHELRFVESWSVLNVYIGEKKQQ